jgi:hypothetical protein
MFKNQMKKKKREPVKMLIGTDWWTDCDDAVAMRVLARMHKKKRIEILAIGVNACMEYSLASIDAFMRNEGLPDISFGIDREACDFGGDPPYQKRLAGLAGKIKSNSDGEDAVSLYRRILSAAPEKIDIIEIGYPNVLANLLASGRDGFSALSGTELVKNKVNKLWMMAGKWDDPINGKENNFARNQRSRTAAAYLCRNWPVPITFLGWEIACNIVTGGNLRQEDILYQVLCDHGSPSGRSSWDPMLTLMACINDEKAAGYSTVCGTAHVDAETGVNRFTPHKNGLHRYVIKNFEDEYYRKAVDAIIVGGISLKQSKKGDK